MAAGSEVAQYINLTDVECTAILQKYREEEERHIQHIKDKLVRGLRNRLVIFTLTNSSLFESLLFSLELCLALYFII